jgi:hypothetical protein|tara:strand:- start:3740 stop:4000 length:261 start_codon:yes stop_codon:yes gene_type:complete
MSYIIVKGENEEIVHDYQVSGVFHSQSAAQMRLNAFRDHLWAEAMKEAARLTSVIRGSGREKLQNLISETRNKVESYSVRFLQDRA